MISLIYALGAGSLLFIAFLILTNPREVNIVANRWLALFIFGLFFLILGDPLFEFKIYNQFPNFLGYESLLTFTIAPALYLCVSHYTLPDKKFHKKDFLHFIPLMALMPFLISTILMSTKEKLIIINDSTEANVLESDFLSYFLITQMVVYTLLSFFKILNHQKNIRLFASDTSNISLNWLKNAILAIFLMLFMWLLEIRFYKFDQVHNVSGFVYFIGIYAIGYYAFRQEEIFPYKEKEIQEIKEIIEETPSSKVQRISHTELENIKIRISDFMENQKLYLDDSLNLPKFAEKVETSIHNLSYVLNEGFQENFFQFVNRYRVEEAKRLLTSERYQQLSMLGIAYESGFSSKTTFNTTFKKITGISPSEYISQAEQNTVTA